MRSSLRSNLKELSLIQTDIEKIHHLLVVERRNQMSPRSPQHQTSSMGFIPNSSAMKTTLSSTSKHITKTSETSPRLRLRSSSSSKTISGVIFSTTPKNLQQEHKSQIEDKHQLISRLTSSSTLQANESNNTESPLEFTKLNGNTSTRMKTDSKPSTQEKKSILFTSPLLPITNMAETLPPVIEVPASFQSKSSATSSSSSLSSSSMPKLYTDETNVPSASPQTRFMKVLQLSRKSLIGPPKPQTKYPTDAGALQEKDIIYSNTRRFSQVPLHENDYQRFKKAPHFRIWRQRRGLNFTHVYVSQDSSISFKKGRIGTQIEIAGSPGTSTAALLTAAHYVSKIVKYMPPVIFMELSLAASIGIFSANEKLTIFPEYEYFRNGNCGSSCSGACARTCTHDGRKVEDLAGIGGHRATILDDNILCTSNDPYDHKENILTHELAHTIHQFALDEKLQAQIAFAFSNAKAKGTWEPSSYAMTNYLEYFAEGASVFFGVNVYNHINTGGMNECGASYCREEAVARNHLRTVDVALYNILTYVFTSGHPNYSSGLSICPDGVGAASVNFVENSCTVLSSCITSGIGIVMCLLIKELYFIS